MAVSIVLGHTKSEGFQSDGAELAKSLVEAEAEAVAFMLCAALGVPGMEEARAYVQHWLAQGSEKFGERNAVRVFSATEKILKAGAPVVVQEAVAA